MSNVTRRSMIRTGVALTIPAGFATLVCGCQRSDSNASGQPQLDSNQLSTAAADSTQSPSGDPMKIYYLEIVTPEADALCDQYSTLHGMVFGEPDVSLGQARTAKLSGGGLIGIRRPMHDQENPVVRPYVLVDDINNSVASAAEAGAKVALPPMEIPGHGTCAIVIQGGIESGLWQV